MRAMACSSFDGPAALAMGELPEPTPGALDVLVEVHAVSLSYMDCLMVSGQYQMRPPLPFAPGTDAAGVVVEVGKDVTRFRVGDRIACGDFFGAFAERIAVNEWQGTRIPDGLSFEVAATVRHAYGTAWYALVERARLQAGETLLVTGAAGGIGLASVDLAVHLGAKVIAGVGADEKADIVRQYGATAVLNYRRDDIRAKIKEFTGGRGVDVCFEVVGGELFDQMTRLMAWNGRLMPIGFAGGKIPSVPMNLPLLKNYSIVGVFTGAAMKHDPEATGRMYDELMRLTAEGALKPLIQEVLPLSQAPQAMQRLLDRKVNGRIVLRVNDA
ncbi:MAG: NADPH:quinone oxidoreductase family protein [Rubrivivax sp.]